MRSKKPFKYLKEDFSASIVVFLVALSLCLGIALASDAPLFSGIIADQMTFLNKARFREVLQRIPEDSHVIIDGSHCRYLDFDVIEVIDEFKQTAAYKDITLELINIPDANKGKFILDLRKSPFHDK
jgi:MFS superfamily sulfate permease-like transporter